MTSRERRQALIVLTGAKTIASTAMRWVAPFLPTLEKAFGASTSQLTSVMGVGELAGLSNVAIGRSVDRGHERKVFIGALSAIALSSMIGLGGNIWFFAISYTLMVLGVSTYTVVSHAWIGHRFAFTERGRAIGLFETGWALSLLVGVPVLSVMIHFFGWRAAYVTLAVVSAAAAVVVSRRVDDSRVHDAVTTSDRLPAAAWLSIFTSATIAMAGIGSFVISGVWLDRDYHVSTTGLGLVAVALGAVELVASSTVATLSDRVGVRRSVVTGLLILIVGLCLMRFAGESRLLAIGGLAVLLGGFEYGFVSSLALVTEAAPKSRARAIGMSSAMGTLARSTAVATSGFLFEHFGITGSITLSAAATGVALVLVALRPSS